MARRRGTIQSPDKTVMERGDGAMPNQIRQVDENMLETGLDRLASEKVEELPDAEADEITDAPRSQASRRRCRHGIPSPPAKSPVNVWAQCRRRSVSRASGCARSLAHQRVPPAPAPVSAGAAHPGRRPMVRDRFRPEAWYPSVLVSGAAIPPARYSLIQ